MGIRFLCNSCQRRLNVEASQAGQYCFCPDCETEILVPLESTIEPSKRKQKRRHKKKPVREVEISPLTFEPQSMELQERSERLAAPAPSVAADVESRQEPVATGEAQTIEASGLFVTPKYGAGKPSVEAERISEFADTGKEKFEARINRNAPGLDDFVEDVESDAGQSDDTASFLLAKPIAKVGADPLKSDPNLVWYLRHKRLGEKGPLKAQQVEAMLESGQIRSGFIVWRQDWNDWLPAEEVFPELVEKPKPKSTYEIPGELNPHSEVSRKRRAQKWYWWSFVASAFLLVFVLFYFLFCFAT